MHFTLTPGFINGTLTYDLPGIGESGSMPIQRVAADNAVVCKVMMPVVQ